MPRWQRVTPTKPAPWEHVLFLVAPGAIPVNGGDPERDRVRSGRRDDCREQEWKDDLTWSGDEAIRWPDASVTHWKPWPEAPNA